MGRSATAKKKKLLKILKRSDNIANLLYYLCHNFKILLINEKSLLFNSDAPDCLLISDFFFSFTFYFVIVTCRYELRTGNVQIIILVSNSQAFYCLTLWALIHCRMNVNLISKPNCNCLNTLNAELNPICYLLALLGAHHFLHVSRIRVKSLTPRLLISYIYIYIYIYI